MEVYCRGCQSIYDDNKHHNCPGPSKNKAPVTPPKENERPSQTKEPVDKLPSRQVDKPLAQKEKEWHAAWREKNREKLREYKREYMREYRARKRGVVT